MKNKIYLCMVATISLFFPITTYAVSPQSPLYNNVCAEMFAQLTKKELEAALKGKEPAKIKSLQQKNQRIATACINEGKRTILYNAKETRVNADTWFELEMHKLAKSIAPALQSGKAALMHYLCSPTTDTEHITTIQDKQKLLEEDNEASSSLEELLRHAVTGEEKLLDLWDQQIVAQNAALTNRYQMQIPLIKDSATALTATSHCPSALLIGGFFHNLYNAFKYQNTKVINLYDINKLDETYKKPTAESIQNLEFPDYYTQPEKAFFTNLNEDHKLTQLEVQMMKRYITNVEETINEISKNQSALNQALVDLKNRLDKKEVVKNIISRSSSTLSITSSTMAVVSLHLIFTNPIEYTFNTIIWILHHYGPEAFAEFTTYSGMSGCYGILAAMGLYRNYQQRTSPSETAMHQSLIDIADYMRSAEKIYKLIQQNNALKAQFPHFCPTYEELRDDKSTQSIINDLLQTNTFTGSPSFFSNIGRIALVSDRLAQAKEKFVPLMLQMGELDTVSSVVNYKKAHPEVFRYAQSTRSERAFIIAKDFVHPAAPYNTSNSISCGGDEPKVVIVTGPNGCGKSGNIKAMVASILALQSLGFGPGSIKASSFDAIEYIANVGDKLGEKSRYQAEVSTISNTYKTRLKAINEKELILSIHDEPLSATNAKGGATGLWNFIKRIVSKNSNSIDIIITHHYIPNRFIDKLPDWLSKKFPSLKKNTIKRYRVGDGDKKFTLEEGQSHYSNAEQLVDDALNEIDAECLQNAPKKDYDHLPLELLFCS